MTAAAIKVSAGAAEFMSLLDIGDSPKFIRESSVNGWKIYAAVPPPMSSSHSGLDAKPPPSSDTVPEHIQLADVHKHLRKHPCLLMLGSEGTGLRWALRSQAHYSLGIEGRIDRQEGLDSLNVGVAAGVLCDAFLGKTFTNDQGQHQADAKSHEEKLW